MVLDKIKDESGERKSLYEDNNSTSNEDEKLVSADDFKGSLEDTSDKIINSYKEKLAALRKEREKLDAEKFKKNEQGFAQNMDQASKVSDEFADKAADMENRLKNL